MDRHSDREKDRSAFLIAMYNQLMADINRHIIVIWQSVGVLFAAFAALSVVKSGAISIDYVATLLIIVCIWVLAHVIEASYWYNRNLVIIANIERIFLYESDLKDVHYYFGKHRRNGRMIAHLRIQRNLAVCIAIFVLTVQVNELLQKSSEQLVHLSPSNLLPWAAASFGLLVWEQMVRQTDDKYEEFLDNSPGREIDASSVHYGGRGHPVKKP